MSGLSFREGRPGDLRATFELGEAAWDESRKARGLLPPDHRRDRAEIREQWDRARPFIEFVAAQPDGAYWICEDGDELVGYVRVARFGSMDELTELWVTPRYAGRGVGRALLERVADEARRRGLAYLTISPESRNVDAIRSLHAAGYDVVSSIKLTLDLDRHAHHWEKGLQLHELQFRA